MSEILDLNKLTGRRRDLLMAEVAAWLHDMGKCADAFLDDGGTGFKAICKDSPWVNPHKAVFSPGELKSLPYWGNLRPDPGRCARLEEANHFTALWRTIEKLGLTIPVYNIDLNSMGKVSLRELILWGRPFVSKNYDDFKTRLKDLTYLAAVLGWAHKKAHMEKEDVADGGASRSIDSPFGAPIDQINKLDDKLSAVLSALPRPRAEFVAEVKRNFRQALGDTRCPANEVTLWDWCSIVAALYKAELARCILTKEQRHPQDAAWRLLSIRTDGLGYLLSVPSVPDLLARKALLEAALNRVKVLLEETYPLGLEVYRDENGSIFVVPDIENIDISLVSLVDTTAQKTLRELIMEAFAEGTVKNDHRLRVDGEVVPDVHTDNRPWNGEPPDGLPPVGTHLGRRVHLTSAPRPIADAWRDQRTEICVVCGLRPQGPGKKAADRNMCNVCEQRRADRSKDWATEHLGRTIWTDEAADINGLLALIVGQFDLTHWLSGDLVRTLAAKKPEKNSNKTEDGCAKNPSFARLRRIWETTRRFWYEVASTDDDKDLTASLVGKVVGQHGPRLQVRPKNAEDLELKNYHAYDLVLPSGVKISAVWEPQNKRFITAENLLYIASSLSEENAEGYGAEGSLKEYATEKSMKAYRRAAETVKAHLVGELTVEEPTGYGARSKVLGKIAVEKEGASEISGSDYVPAIPILAEPRTFMLLMPADKALEVAKEIKAKYEREMGKVRNRLPLHLGIVFAHRRTPLRAILDAGRQMLQQKGEASIWNVICAARKMNRNGDVLPERLKENQNGQFSEWFEVLLERDRRRITWYVPVMMGDGRTDDLWYPYVFLDTPTDREPTDRQRYFRAWNPWSKQKGLLVYVGDLKSGDTVYFTPSTFDFEFLDTTARRFEIQYDESGRRTSRRTRPFYLDDLDRFEELWGYMRRLAKSQRYQVVYTIETTRENWYRQDFEGGSLKDGVFRQFVADTLVGASWPKEYKWSSIPPRWQEELIEAGVRGELADLAELHMEILKNS